MGLWAIIYRPEFKTAVIMIVLAIVGVALIPTSAETQKRELRQRSHREFLTIIQAANRLNITMAEIGMPIIYVIPDEIRDCDTLRTYDQQHSGDIPENIRNTCNR